MDIACGDVVTIKDEIFSESGRIIFHKGTKVQISEVIKKEAFWGKMSGVYYPEEITGLKIIGISGEWSLETFKETSRNPIITREVLVEKFKFY